MEKNKKSTLKKNPVYQQLKLGLEHSLKYICKFVDKEQVPTMEHDNAVIQSDGSVKVVRRTVKDYTNLINDHRSQLLELPKVKDLIEFLAKNEYINELIFTPLKSKLAPYCTVGYTHGYKKDKVRDIFLKFLINYCKFEVFPFFKEKYFYDLFVRLMYYLQSNKKWCCLSPLSSFEMETTSIELEDGVSIRRIKPEEFLVMNEKKFRSFDSFNEKYVIELCSDMSLDTTQSFFYEDQMNFVLESLRLFKKGGVDSILTVGGIDDDKWILGTQGAIIFNTHRIPNPVVYSLSKNEVIRLKKFYKQYKNTKFEYIRNAVKRFSSAIKEKDLDDKIIDFIIALEYLFSDGQGELTYKLRVRIAFLIGATENKANYLHEFIGKAYDVRSNTVHGSGRKWNFVIDGRHLVKEQVVAQLEDITRLVIKRILNITLNYNAGGKDDILKQIDRLMINAKKPGLKVKLA